MPIMRVQPSEAVARASLFLQRNPSGTFEEFASMLCLSENRARAVLRLGGSRWMEIKKSIVVYDGGKMVANGAPLKEVARKYDMHEKSVSRLLIQHGHTVSSLRAQG